MQRTAAVVLVVLLLPSLTLGQTRGTYSVPEHGNLTMVRLEGADAKAAFMGAISKEGLQTALQHARERNLQPTDLFTVYEIRPKAGVLKTQTEVGLPGGRVLIWEWEDYDLSYTSGTMIVETWSPSTSTTFDFRYWVNDDWGVTDYARFIEGRDREGRQTRASGKSEFVDVPRLLRTAFGQTDCGAERAAWRWCMRECVKERLNASIWAAVGGGIGSIRSCAQGATRAGSLGPYVAAGAFVGCSLLGAGMAGGFALVYQFGSRDACDAPSQCGAAPQCQ